jgi:hypothetical protein
MPKSEQEPPVGAGQPPGQKHRPLFAPNRSGFGFHPSRWEGWLIILVIVAAIMAAVVLFRTGVI